MTMRQLPTFQGYTVDVRLKQFCKVDRSKPSIEFIDFDSEQGSKLYSDWLDQDPNALEEVKQNW
jgi:hypothetical protein